MGVRWILLWFALLTRSFASPVSADAKPRTFDSDFARCHHERNDKLVYGVQTSSSGGDINAKRQSMQFQPFRIQVFYDSTVNTELDDFQRNRLQNIIIPRVEANFEAALSVIPAISPILLDRDCANNDFQVPIGSVRNCTTQCNAQTTCVDVLVPEEHLKRCVQCNGDAPNCETIGSDGPGVSDTDYILYVGANGTFCGGGTLAFANVCQLEAMLDRPIAGAINFCPNQLPFFSDDDNVRIGMHEVIHTLGFSPTLYPFFRDEAGVPRTPRDVFGFPPRDSSGNFIISNTTIRTTTYTDWQTRNGIIDHQVQQFVTPNILEQGRAHYNCPTLEGVELENQGGPGTSFAHWEQRVLGNEGMTGSLLFNIHFSRLTYALLEDTGWYRVNYDFAEPLAFGQNAGCRLPHGSCGEFIQTQVQRGATPAPYCNHLLFQGPTRLGCTVDREIVSFCILVDFGSTPPPTEFQYFNSGPNFDASIAPRVGGALTIPDFCPLQVPISVLTGTSMVCSQAADQPSVNLYAETYGPGSRCIEQGREWLLTTSGSEPGITSPVFGGGCYQFSCSATNGVEILVLGLRFRCNCEGEELVLDITVSGSRYQGSLICPSCAQLCYDDLSRCPDPEPSACYGRETAVFGSGSGSGAVSGSGSGVSGSGNGSGAVSGSGSGSGAVVMPFEVGLEQDSYSVGENVGDSNLALLVCAITSSDVQFRFAVTVSLQDGTAVAGLDFPPIVEVLNFFPGIGRQCVCIEILQDTEVEGDEMFSVLLSTTFPDVVITRSTSTVTIMDDDDPVVVEFDPTTYTVTESQGAVVMFQIVKRTMTRRTVSVLFSTSPGTATDTADFTRRTNIAVTFAPVETEQNVRVSIVNDDTVENTEIFSALLTAIPGSTVMIGAAGTATATITDDDMVQVTFVPSVYFVNENEGTVTLMVRKMGQSVIPVTVDISTFSADATDGTDFMGIVQQTLIFPAGGDDVIGVSIPLINDIIFEDTEVFFSTLVTSDPNVMILENQAIVVIFDDDAVMVTFDPSLYIVNENDGSVTLMVRKIGQSVFPVTVDISTFSGSATDGTDFMGIVQRILTFPAGGDDVIGVSIPLINDTIHEPTEFFISTLFTSDPNALIIEIQAIVEIVDDDVVMVTFVPSEYTVNENEGTVTLMVRKIGQSVFPVFVDISTSSGSAIDGTDFMGIVQQTLIFPAGGDDVIEVSVPLIDDLIDEPTEDFSSNLVTSDPNVMILENQAIVEIVDDDLVPVLFDPILYIVNENDGSVTLMVRKIGQSVFPVTVDISTFSGSATDGTDFMGIVQRTLTFPAGGDDVIGVSIPLINDTIDEPTEDFSSTLVTSDPNVMILENEAIVGIVDDDPIDLTLRWINDSPRVEGNSVMADLAIGSSFQSVICQVTRSAVQDCSSGRVTFTDLQDRRVPFTFTVEGIGPAGEIISISRTFRVETITDCWLHLINDGITITGDTVAVQWQATGPSADNRATMFNCVLDGRIRACEPSEGFTLSRLASGPHELVIRPTDPDCTRRRIERRLTFQIA